MRLYWYPRLAQPGLLVPVCLRARVSERKWNQHSLVEPGSRLVATIVPPFLHAYTVDDLDPDWRRCHVAWRLVRWRALAISIVVVVDVLCTPNEGDQMKRLYVNCTVSPGLPNFRHLSASLGPPNSDYDLSVNFRFDSSLPSFISRGNDTACWLLGCVHSRTSPPFVSYSSILSSHENSRRRGIQRARCAACRHHDRCR